VPLVTSTNVLALAATRVVLAVIVERTMVGLDDIVVQLGNPDPALVNTCPLVPVAPAKVNAVVRLADAITGEVEALENILQEIEGIYLSTIYKLENLS
jgi:hypothetical protein